MPEADWDGKYLSNISLGRDVSTPGVNVSSPIRYYLKKDHL